MFFLGDIGHPLRSYLYYVGYLYQKMDPLPEQELYEVVPYSILFTLVFKILGVKCLLGSHNFALSLQLSYRDFLQSPLQVMFFNGSTLILAVILFSFYVE